MILHTSECGVSPSNSATDNATAFEAMLAIAAGTNTAIVVDDGPICLDRPLSCVTANSLIIEGRTDMSALRWQCDNGGLQIAYTDWRKPPKIEALNLETDRASGGVACKVIGPDVEYTTEAGPSIVELDCRGSDPEQYYWAKGLHLKNLWHPTIAKPDIRGLEQSYSPFMMEAAIEAENCTGVRIEDQRTFHAKYGYRLTGTKFGEGLQIVGGEVVGVDYGISHESPNFIAGTTISDLHINAYKRGIVLKNVAQIFVHDLLLYKTHPSNDPWQGIEMVNVNDSKVHHIVCGTPGVTGSSDANGITLVGCHGVSVESIRGVLWHNPGTLVLATGGSDDNQFDMIWAAEDCPNLTPLLVLTGSNNMVGYGRYGHA